MDRGRTFAHIYEINSFEIKAYLLPGTESLVQSHIDGVTRIGRIGSFVIINSAGCKIVGIINSLHVTEPEKLFMLKTKQELCDRQLIRTMTINLVGQIHDDSKSKYFERGITVYPSIDESIAIPTQEQLNLILNEESANGNLLKLGEVYSNPDINVEINPSKLLSRHVAVVGSTGNGKSCTVTVLVKEILKRNKKTKLPIAIFDINGEYAWAFKNEENLKVIKFAEAFSDIPSGITNKIDRVKINFHSFSRRTWRNILKPSDKTQIPALNFAIDSLPFLGYKFSDLDYTQCSDVELKILEGNDRIVGDSICGKLDETDSETIKKAKNFVDYLNRFNECKIKINSTKSKSQSFSMPILASIICDRWAISLSRNGFIFDTFKYSNVSSLCDRITEFSRDELFNRVFDIHGNSGINLESLVQDKSCSLIIYDFSGVAQEYLPHVVDALLEQYLIQALNGCYKSNPNLLVLDEAHHYLKGTTNGDDFAYLGTSPGERIAKEGRKFGLHLLISTQRPRELSSTIISQVGTVITHALTQDADKNIITSFGNYADKSILGQISVLPRREAIIIGQAVSTPTRVKISFLQKDDRPKSKDPLEDTFN